MAKIRRGEWRGEGAHLDPSKLTEGASKAAVFPHSGFLNSHEFSPAGGVIQVCLTPLSSGSMAIQKPSSFFRSQEDEGGSGKEKDLIPESVAQTCQRAAEKTLACPLVSFPRRPSR